MFASRSSQSCFPFSRLAFLLPPSLPLGGERPFPKGEKRREKNNSNKTKSKLAHVSSRGGEEEEK